MFNEATGGEGCRIDPRWGIQTGNKGGVRDEVCVDYNNETVERK